MAFSRGLQHAWCSSFSGRNPGGKATSGWLCIFPCRKLTTHTLIISSHRCSHEALGRVARPLAVPYRSYLPICVLPIVLVDPEIDQEAPDKRTEGSHNWKWLMNATSFCFCRAFGLCGFAAGVWESNIMKENPPPAQQRRRHFWSPKRC